MIPTFNEVMERFRRGETMDEQAFDLRLFQTVEALKRQYDIRYDPAHPVPEGRSLDATRRICISPFPEDQGRVLYFAGYDGPYADNRSAWIYRATLPEAGGGDNR